MNKDVKVPMVVRMVGTNVEEGCSILEKGGIKAFDSMEECAASITQ